MLAVPGNADSQKSSGTNSLIKQGAKLVTCAEDILEELNLSPVKPKLAVNHTLTQEEDKILSLLESEPLQVETLLEESGLSAPETASLLSLLEVKGYVRELPGKFFAKK